MRKKGISLIVLIVTIIVVIILAAAVILTLSKNNPIESAKEARFKEDVRTFQDELALTVSKQYATAGGHRDEKISTSNFDEIKEYIPSFSEKYRDKFVIKDDELVYTTKLDEKEKEYAQNLNVNKRISILPDEYQRVEYIESTGTQYIDTGIKLNQNSRVKVKYQYSAGARVARVFGDAHNNSKGWVLTTQDGTTNTKIQTLYGDTWKPQPNEPQSIIPSTNIVEFERNGVNQYVNNNLYYTNRSSNFETTSTAIVFGAYYKSFSLSSIKLYELWIWEDGTNISRHFQPCYRKSDNKPGLYDTVTKEFYTNQGTGEDFIPGPDVD